MNTRIAMHLQTHRGQCDCCELTGWCNYLWVGIYDEQTKVISPFHLWTDRRAHSQMRFPGGELIQKFPQIDLFDLQPAGSS